MITHWCPSSILAKDEKPKKFCLIVLNQPINHVDAFHRLWTNASLKFVADGGSNRLYDVFKHDQQLLSQGDLDSIRPEVRAYYESKNVKITKINDQDSTDFMKCVALLKEKEKESGQTVFATPALGGRFDQTIASINLLYMLKNEIERRVILVSDENLTMLLDKGAHQIHCQLDLEGPTCGIMPIGFPAIISTKGLKWNLDNVKCEFGGMVSTSNHVDDELVEIVTDSPIIWTIEINLKQ
ncbi:thiamine pyrophosphokinase [Cokeromyces recurvatus]|uniref:thiamine pyrophosphokinase n=1 Tax=Cokeromyces recurvatus TaxID=90255 RepID=UPI002221197D|nr:thiamine pyrophosphokinase [Cokeromyces recurvatus]KAI7901834.1 thiamine pyrophosphokinase [Cokeromyces recurvatus]